MPTLLQIDRLIVEVLTIQVRKNFTVSKLDTK